MHSVDSTYPGSRPLALQHINMKKDKTLKMYFLSLAILVQVIRARCSVSSTIERRSTHAWSVVLQDAHGIPVVDPGKESVLNVAASKFPAASKQVSAVCRLTRAPPLLCHAPLLTSSSTPLIEGIELAARSHAHRARLLSWLRRALT
jgi:hypothetical protein